MVHLNKQRLPTSRNCKLQSKEYGLFPIVKKISNFYVIGLPQDWKISTTVNIANVYTYFPLMLLKLLLRIQGRILFKRETLMQKHMSWLSLIYCFILIVLLSITIVVCFFSLHCIACAL